MAATLPDDILDRLTAGIRELGTSSAWLDWLRVQSRFWHYSANNTLLIAMQCPGATHVAGFRAWLGMGRCVRKGEHGLAILAPIVRRRQAADDGQDDERIVAGFRLTHVFDISQTDGDELPTVPCHRLTGEAPDTVIAALETAITGRGFTVTLAALGETANGVTNFARRSVAINDAVAPAQRCKTLAHELAHILLHEHTDQTRERVELEAEAVAWVVCDQVGIDATDYSMGYVATWMTGTDAAIEGVRQSTARIARAARTILTELAEETALEGVA
jgi:antirestriction protein ArdC